MAYNFLDSLEVGDMIDFNRGIYSHFAVYIGNEEVIHLAGRGWDFFSRKNIKKFCIGGKLFNKAQVTRDSFYRAMDGCTPKIGNKDNKRNPLPKKTIKERAMSSIGRVGYNLITSNCEHFANWCRYGEAVSDQINDINDYPAELYHEFRDMRISKPRGRRT